MKNLSSDDRPLFPPPGRTAREDTAAVMKFYRLPRAFPKAVEEEAARLRVDAADFAGRLDLRRKFVFTCDPQSARDYDDALSLETDRRGNRVLGVHIADVSHFVRPGSAIDREAFKRSTSVYLCDRVVPMLPERLCNGLCSLVPGEDRLAFSVFMTFDRKGEMIGRSFARSVVRSQARFTYEEVMAVIKAGRPAGSSGMGRREVRTVLQVNELAQQLRALRFAAGALDIEIPEAEVILDDNQELAGLVTRPYDESHQMIEECMVAANEAVAKELWTNGVKILSRLHEPPDPEKIQLLREELRGLGVKVGNLENPKVFAQFLQTIKSHPLYPTLSVMVLRSMKKAVYDATAIGHFGLAKRYYAHFTSPIRRYPDLTLHRQLAAYIGGAAPGTARRGDPAKAKVPPRVLAAWAEHTSEREQLAAEAERGLLEIKKYRLLEDQLNTRQVLDYDAVIVKCMPFGCFVELPELAVSGLVHVSLLSRRFVRYNESDRSLSAPGGGSWHIGDRLRVRVARVDFRERRIDFVPVGADPHVSGARSAPEKKEKKEKRRRRQWN